MTNPRAGKTAEPGTLAGALLSLINVSLSELRQDLRRLMESNWAAPERRRAHELASALADACGRQKLSELADVFRSIGRLAALDRLTAAPLRSELKEKFDQLLRQAEGMIAASKRHTG